MGRDFHRKFILKIIRKFTGYNKRQELRGDLFFCDTSPRFLALLQKSAIFYLVKIMFQAPECRDINVVMHSGKFFSQQYRISSNKRPRCLLNFETVRCGAC